MEVRAKVWKARETFGYHWQVRYLKPGWPWIVKGMGHALTKKGAQRKVDRVVRGLQREEERRSHEESVEEQKYHV